jgi:hypothetical protein
MTDESKQGPPHPNAEGLDAPSPPGGPLRQDGKGEGHLTGGHDDDASASSTNDTHASESGGGTIPLEDEQSHPHPDSEEDDVEQGGVAEENAETSLDQPSEG